MLGYIVLVAALVHVTTATTTSYSPIPTTAPSTWVHPGVFVHQKQLDLIADKVSSKAEPWSSALTSMLAHPLASQTRKPTPFEVVECGSQSTPNVGCYTERQDSMAAYVNALAWCVTKETKYATKAVEYLDAWAGVIVGHNNSNAPVQAGWSAANWVRAGEMMRYAGGGGGKKWSSAGIKRFEGMLRDVYLPLIQDGRPRTNGNWELVMLEATLGAAVFLEDETLYSRAMALFARRVPAYVYLTSDGPLPVPGRGNGADREAIVEFWYGQGVFNVSGLAQETCRDYRHASYGIASISHVAETARIQGFDLWDAKYDLGKRVGAAVELHATYDGGWAEVPKWLCGGQIPLSMDPVLETPYNALAYRQGNDKLLHTGKLVVKQRPAEIGGTSTPVFVGFETLTNAEMGL